MKFNYSATPILSLITLFLYTLQVQAYCIYNKSPTRSIRANQAHTHTTANDFSLFKSGDLSLGDKGCCPYTTLDCSYRGRPDEDVLVNIVVEESMYSVGLEAGGWVEVYDKNEGSKEVKIVTYRTNGTVAPCSQRDPPLFDRRRRSNMKRDDNIVPYDDCPLD